jgi:hypothetical protein
MYISGSLETILSHLSARVLNVIANGNCLRDLHHLLEFLAAWKERPACLTPMAYQWCSAIFEAAGRLGWGGLTGRQEILLQLRLGLQDPALSKDSYTFQFAERQFSEVGHHFDFIRLGDTPHHPHGSPQDPPPGYADLLPTTLEIGFRLITPGGDQPALRSYHTSHHDRMFETAFSSGDDDLIADTLSVWVVDDDWAPPGPCVRYLTKRMEGDTPFSPRLRQVSIQAIEHTWRGELEVSGSETVHLLNRLDVDIDDMVGKGIWMQLLVGVICIPAGLESLSSHYWRLLDKLASGAALPWVPGSFNVEVIGSLEKAEDWERLEVWMVVVWRYLRSFMPMFAMGDIERVTLELFLRRAPALQRFEALCEWGAFWVHEKAELQRICEQAHANQLPSESLQLYVSVRPAQYLPALTPLFVFFSQSIHAQPLVPVLFARDDTF